MSPTTAKAWFYRYAQHMQGRRPSQRRHLLTYLKLAEHYGVFDRRGI